MLSDGYKGLHALASAHHFKAYEAIPDQAAADRETALLLRGIGWITLAMALFAGLAGFARAAMNTGIHSFEVVFLRNLFALIAISPVFFIRGMRVFHTENLKLYGLRSGISAVTMLAWFYALSKISIGELTAISFLSPLFGTLAAIVLLGEVVRARRWTALAVGFIGAMIILRPYNMSIGPGQIAALISAGATGFLVILVKQLTARDDANQIVFLTTLILTPLSLVPALFVWSWPGLETLPILIGMGACAVLGHVTLTRGFALLDASLVLTMEFSKLPFGVFIGYMAFGETIDIWTWVGALVIFASGLYITQREAKLRRQGRR